MAVGPNGSADAFTKALRELVEEAVENGNRPLREDIAGLKSDVSVLVKQQADLESQLKVDRENAQTQIMEVNRAISQIGSQSAKQ